jgi:hypothetical protein
LRATSPRSIIAAVGRLTAFGWVLVAGVVATVVLAVVAPGAGLVAVVILALVAVVALADGFGEAAGWFDMGVAAERKRESVGRRLRRGRPEWETTPPDHADEPADAIWARERERRRLP